MDFSVHGLLMKPNLSNFIFNIHVNNKLQLNGTDSSNNVYSYWAHRKSKNKG